MGKSWDASGIAYDLEVWRQALRVLKPGGHLLAFSGSRTYHRMVCAIEDAGLEIRDQIMWLYGSGFPKSHDVSKAIDREAGLLPPEGKGFTVAGYSHAPDKLLHTAPSAGYVRPAPATPEAEQWAGWGTALKPAHEPIVVARKPFKGTVAQNVLAHGTGALNIDGCRVGYASDVDREQMASAKWTVRDGVTGKPGVGGFMTSNEAGKVLSGADHMNDAGRWPANVIHDGSDEVLRLFPESVARPVKPERLKVSGSGEKLGMFGGRPSIVRSGYYDTETSAARFFYCAKASKRDREEGLDSAGSRANHHPTVKPTDLMRYLCRLVTPPGGLVLDPFTGSGSTGKAAVLEGFRFLGCELSEEYAAIARARIAAAQGPGARSQGPDTP
jgi:site-specific DNA-methyltransferase (adenine-specific)